MAELSDCVIIGAGPAGLTAAIYLARFNLATLVFDTGESRCATVPRTRNHAGYPGGIAGAELLARMRAQANIRVGMSAACRFSRRFGPRLPRTAEDFAGEAVMDSTVR
jgi:thioredoxin reductase